jgi:hypothetical protein
MGLELLAFPLPPPSDPGTLLSAHATGSEGSATRKLPRFAVGELGYDLAVLVGLKTPVSISYILTRLCYTGARLKCR